MTAEEKMMPPEWIKKKRNGEPTRAWRVLTYASYRGQSSGWERHAAVKEDDEDHIVAADSYEVIVDAEDSANRIAESMGKHKHIVEGRWYDGWCFEIVDEEAAYEAEATYYPDGFFVPEGEE